jgi:hypothetical protein
MRTASSRPEDDARGLHCHSDVDRAIASLHPTIFRGQQIGLQANEQAPALSHYMPSLWFGLVGSHQQERIVDFDFASSPAPARTTSDTSGPGPSGPRPRPSRRCARNGRGSIKPSPCERWGCPPIGRHLCTRWSHRSASASSTPAILISSTASLSPALRPELPLGGVTLQQGASRRWPSESSCQGDFRSSASGDRSRFRRPHCLASGKDPRPTARRWRQKTSRRAHVVRITPNSRHSTSGARGEVIVGDRGRPLYRAAARASSRNGTCRWVKPRRAPATGLLNDLGGKSD